VAAVVVRVDSPGGEASASEDLYYQLANLRTRMPVVASVTRVGASGAYYASMGANYVMTKPGAMLGSIGVIVGLAPPIELTDTELTTGPFKADGYSRVELARTLEEVKEHFAGTVYAERLIAWDSWRDGAGTLPQTQDSLATGRVWAGSGAVDAGVADGFGSTTDAVRLAAEMAGAEDYEVRYLTYQLLAAEGYPVLYQDDNLPTYQEALARMNEWPGSYWYLYMPPVE
jgi:protease-4